MLRHMCASAKSLGSVSACLVKLFMNLSVGVLKEQTRQATDGSLKLVLKPGLRD